MAKGIFVTGSGTGVGKTYIATTLLPGFAKLQRGATYMKPVETGCKRLSDGKILAGPDTLEALDYIYDKYKAHIDLHSPYRFHPACSPHLAARKSGREISIKHIVQTYKKLQKETAAEVVVVEGAGGILVPISDNLYVADMIKALAIPVVLVVEAGLGTLNHTFMSLRILKQYNIPLAGVVINNVRNVKQDFIYKDNIKTIRSHIHPLPYFENGYEYTSNKHLTEFCDEIVPRV